MIPLVKPLFGNEEVNAVKRVLDSGWVAGQGPAGAEFEQKFKDKFGYPNAVAVNNCTAALHLSLLSLGIGPGDEVLVSDYTYPATAHAVKYCGAKPIFVDIHEDTYNMNVADAEEKITDHTKAIMPVHAFGQSADLDSVHDLARKRGLKVIEDAACAVGTKFKGQFVGKNSEFACFSFHARKGISTGEGGMLVTRSASLAEKARSLSCFGIQSAFKRQSNEFVLPSFRELGYNYKLSDILSAIGVEQLIKLDGIISSKRKLAKAYREELEGANGITPPFEDPRGFHVYQSFVCLVGEGVNRDKLIQKLRENGICAQIGTYACHLQPVYGSKQACPVSKDVFERALALPLYAEMTEEEVHSVVKKIGACIK